MPFRMLAPFFVFLVTCITTMFLGGWIARNRPVSVVVASELVPPFHSLTAEMLSFRSMPGGEVPPGAIRTKEELQDHSLVMLALPGQALTASMLGPETGGDHFDDKGSVPHRLAIDDSAGVLQACRPGDVVDVFFTYKSRDPEENGRLKTDRILAGSRIRSIGLFPNPSVSLLVQPRDQTLLQMAREMGSMKITVTLNDRERSGGTPGAEQSEGIRPEERRQVVLRVLPPEDPHGQREF